jgi:hypothetical protein
LCPACFGRVRVCSPAPEFRACVKTGSVAGLRLRPAESGFQYLCCSDGGPMAPAKGVFTQDFISACVAPKGGATFKMGRHPGASCRAATRSDP